MYCRSAGYMLEEASMILSLFFSFLFFLLTPSLSFVLYQTHSFLMEFQNTSYIERERERERERRRYLPPYTLLTNIFIILSLIFFLLYISIATNILSFIQYNSRLPVFQNTHTQNYTYEGKKPVFHISVSFIDYFMTKFS